MRCRYCHRKVGLRPNGRALPYVVLDGIVQCQDKGACKRARVLELV